jgi:hypothetical protein
MKARYIALLFAVWYFLLFNGCATTPLKVETDGPNFAEIVGVDPSEVKFLSYCKFAFAKSDHESHTLWSFKEGVVLLTGTHLFILKRDLSDASTKDMVITQSLLSNFSGVGMGETLLFRQPVQLQLSTEDKILIVEAWPNKMWRDEFETTRLYELIVAAGVHREKNEQEFWEFAEASGCPLRIPVPLAFPL